jgi:hypothetical protein
VQYIENAILNRLSVSELGITQCQNRDAMPVFYVRNPPRHGKSRLLDDLFLQSKDVAVLAISYSGFVGVSKDELKTVDGAISGFLTRLLTTLLDENATFAQFFETARVRNVAHFFSLVPLEKLPNIVIAVDELSNLVHHKDCAWASQSADFWTAITSLLRPGSKDTSFRRLVITGFTSEPSKQLAASGIPVKDISFFVAVQR